MTTPGKPRAPRARTEQPSRERETPTTLAVPIGPRVLEVLELAYRARRPILLEGPTGIGKSQIVSEFARSAGIAFTVLDLSLLEPPDLVGLPVIEAGRTRYASPAELPSSGRGILMLEELNRAELPVMQPALQLLSARHLHSYELPPGWTCVAAINPEDGDYQVNRLDPALRSRFLQLSVEADRETWLDWATSANVHPLVVRVVQTHPDAFEQVSPRSWTYASDLLHVLRAEDHGNRDLVQVTLRGYLPSAWAALVTSALASEPSLPTLDPRVILGPDGAAEIARLAADLARSGRVDGIAMIASALRRLLASDKTTDAIEAGTLDLAALEARVAPLPGDLREQCLETAVRSRAAPALLAQLGFDPTAIPTGYRGSTLARQVQAWRRDLAVVRVRLVVAAAVHVLEGPIDDRAIAARVPHLRALVEDAGPIADDLARWLRAHAPEALG